MPPAFIARIASSENWNENVAVNTLAPNLCLRDQRRFVPKLHGLHTSRHELRINPESGVNDIRVIIWAIMLAISFWVSGIRYVNNIPAPRDLSGIGWNSGGSPQFARVNWERVRWCRLKSCRPALAGVTSACTNRAPICYSKLTQSRSILPSSL